MLTVFVTYSYFLGLRTLTVIDDAVQYIEKNQKIKIDIDKINTQDKQVYALIASGQTEGIFQLESPGMKNFMKELAPTCLEDIIAGVALYRPGPMDFIPKYVQAKKDSESISYTHPKLEPILKPTYGCIIYQEQVMQIVRDLAGYSLGRSDLLRRAMSKKKLDVMNKERDIFIYGDGEQIPGCIANGIDKACANQIFDEMVDFAKYAFNRSHAAAYAIVAYQTAYLKTYYKVEFMAALMTSVMDHTTKITGYIDSCKKLAIEVLPPNINASYAYFTPEGSQINFGLAAVKSVGKAVTERIVKEREERGLFKSLTDFYQRMDNKDTNKRSIENLILAGAFDTLGGARSQYMAVYKQISDGVNYQRKHKMLGQIDLFNLGATSYEIEAQDNLPNIPEYDSHELLAHEKEVLGFYLSGHPLDKVKTLLSALVSATTNEVELGSDNQAVVIGGIITERKTIFTKNNQKMAFITLEDLRGTIEVIIFPNLYDQFIAFQEDSILLIHGRISVKEEQSNVVIAEKIEPLDSEYILLKLDKSQRTKEMRQALLTLFKLNQGKTKVIVENRENGIKKAFPAKYNVQISHLFMKKLADLLGTEAIDILKN